MTDVIKSPKVNIVFDASQYDMFSLCEQRFHIRYDLNKVIPEKAKPLDKGTLVHIAEETYWESLQSGAKYDYAVSSALMKIREAGVIATDLSSEEILRIVDVMEENFDHWRVADQGFKIEAVEKPFIYLLYEDDEIRIYMTGKIDLVVSDNKYTNLPYDHKSFERSGEVNEMSNQFKNYCYALKSNYLIVNRIGFQKTLPPHEKYLRVPVTYDHLQLEQWKNNVVRRCFWYLQCVAEYQRSGLSSSFPLNETSCDKFNRRCEYYDVCKSSGIEAKEFKLANNYIEVDKWDVTKSMRKTSEIISDLEKEKEKLSHE